MDRQNELKIILWNSNGLSQHILELRSFLQQNSVDVLLVSETHFTQKSFVNIPNYSIFHTNHPDNTAHGGTAIIIRKTIKCTEIESYKKDYLQATSILIEDLYGPMILSAVYCPPKHNNTKILYLDFLKSLGNRFIAGGDFNSKNTIWGSRITLTKGKNLLEAIREHNCKFISTGEPTYWPTNINKKPDLIDFFITKNVQHENLKTESCFDLSSDHSPVVLKFQGSLLLEKLSKNIYNKKTDWDCFREIMDMNLETNISLKNEKEVDSSIAYLNDTILFAATNSTPLIKQKISNYSISPFIKETIKTKRKLRKQWQTTRAPQIKTKLNQITRELKEMLKRDKEQKLAIYLTHLGSNHSTNYSLWKATKNINNGIIHQPPIQKDDQTWARTHAEKANVLSEHFYKTFTNPMNNTINTLPDIPDNTDNSQIKKITSNEIRRTIETKIDIKKSPGYDRITGKVLKELPEKAITYIRNIFNVLINMKYFPSVWKVAEIIAIPKPNKDATKASSYRPISLLPVLSKLFEKLIFERLEPIINERNLIPAHQFGFRRKHSTIQQVHRVINKISSEIDKKSICVATYLDVAKAFDSVWHDGLLHKLKQQLPYDYFLILRSYISNRNFYVKYKEECSKIMKMEAGVPQGSVLGPMLYLLYTADIPTPTTNNKMIATFADDTVLLASHKDINNAITDLQGLLDNTLDWFAKWGILVNSDKTVQVTYTNRRIQQHRPISINNVEIFSDSKAKYLGILIDSKLLWKDHINQKRVQMRNKFRQLFWLLSKESKVSTHNKLLIYNSIIAPIWKYGIELWGTASRSNIQIIQRVQSKILRTIINAEWYISNEDIHRDLGVKTVEEVIRNSSHKHTTRLQQHTNTELRQLPAKEASEPRRLQRFTPTELCYRFQ